MEIANGSCYATSHVPFYMGWILGLVGLWILIVCALFAVLSFLTVLWRGN